MIETIEKDGLLERARQIEALVLGRLGALKDPRIGDVRGRGAMLAMEFVDPATGEPDAALAKTVAAYAHSQAVITLTCGTYGNVIRFLPPLSISDELIGEGLDIIAAGLEASK